MALLCGVDVDRVIAATFAVGSALAALGGVLIGSHVGQINFAAKQSFDAIVGSPSGAIFGGGARIVKGMIAEILLSATLAPIFMVANTVAVTKILVGQDSGWHAQQRDVDGISWGDAFRAMARALPGAETLGRAA